MPEVAQGRTVGRYRIERRLAEGGMGVVFEALDTTTQRRVALKSLRDAGDAARRARLQREAQLGDSLDHPGIVRVDEVVTDGDDVFLAMELVDGVSLRARLDELRARGERLNVEASVGLARAVAEAVAHAHQKGVVHRDLKPENVMLSAGTARVLDFGLAKLRETEGGVIYSAETQSNVTVEGQVLGTPAYMAPEQARGQEVGFRADVFALGVMLYEMLAGERPFQGGSTADLIAALTRDEPPPPSSLNPGVPRALDALVARCLAKRAEDRPTMEGLARALAAPPLPEVHARWARPVGLLALASVVIATGLAWRSHAAPAPAPQARAAPTAAPAPAPGELPRDASKAAEAARAYDAALKAEHEGDGDAALSGLESAVALDPGLASAHLHIALRLAFLDAQNARDHFAHALAARYRLSPHDDELLEAARPIFQRDPPDLASWEAKLAELCVRHPHDVALELELAKARDALGDFAGAAATAEQASRDDPEDAFALATLAQEQAYEGQFERAKATIARCLSVSASASWCTWVAEFIDGNDGRCEAILERAHARIAADPTQPDSYKALAYGLAATGRPERTVQEACDQAVEHTPDAFGKERLRLNLALRLEALAGRLDDAKETARQLRALVAPRTDSADHAMPDWLSVELAEETGDETGAAAIAADFLERKDVWLSNPVPNDYALAYDLTPRFLAVARAAHALPEARAARSLGDWRERWRTALHGGWRPYLWVYGWAALAQTTADGAGAVRALEQLGPVPPFVVDGELPEAAVGRALWLGGSTKEALPHLQRAARSCDLLPEPIAWVRAHGWLGDALAATGDTKGACAAYRVVLDRWGKAARSVIASHARERFLALRCTGR